jgi:adenylate kinase
LKELNNNIIGVTGTPGTGKKTIGKLLAKDFGYNFIDLNKLAIEGQAILTNKAEFTEIDTFKLKPLVLSKINQFDSIIAGHLLPYVMSANQVKLVVVLRCSPFELEKRYKNRKYSNIKIKENISSEILDICFAESLKTFGEEKIAEFDTTRKIPEELVKEIKEVYNGLKNRKVGTISWLSNNSAEQLIERYLQ